MTVKSKKSKNSIHSQSERATVSTSRGENPITNKNPIADPCSTMEDASSSISPNFPSIQPSEDLDPSIFDRGVDVLEELAKEDSLSSQFDPSESQTSTQATNNTPLEPEEIPQVTPKRSGTTPIPLGDIPRSLKATQSTLNLAVDDFSDFFETHPRTEKLAGNDNEWRYKTKVKIPKYAENENENVSSYFNNGASEKDLFSSPTPTPTPTDTDTDTERRRTSQSLESHSNSSNLSFSERFPMLGKLFMPIFNTFSTIISLIVFNLPILIIIAFSGVVPFILSYIIEIQPIFTQISSANTDLAILFSEFIVNNYLLTFIPLGSVLLFFFITIASISIVLKYRDINFNHFWRIRILLVCSLFFLLLFYIPQMPKFFNFLEYFLQYSPSESTKTLLCSFSLILYRGVFIPLVLLVSIFWVHSRTPKGNRELELFPSSHLRSILSKSFIPCVFLIVANIINVLASFFPIPVIFDPFNVNLNQCEVPLISLAASFLFYIPFNIFLVYSFRPLFSNSLNLGLLKRLQYLQFTFLFFSVFDIIFLLIHFFPLFSTITFLSLSPLDIASFFHFLTILFFACSICAIFVVLPVIPIRNLSFKSLYTPAIQGLFLQGDAEAIDGDVDGASIGVDPESSLTTTDVTNVTDVNLTKLNSDPSPSATPLFSIKPTSTGISTNTSKKVVKTGISAKGVRLEKKTSKKTV